MQLFADELFKIVAVHWDPRAIASTPAARDECPFSLSPGTVQADLRPPDSSFLRSETGRAARAVSPAAGAAHSPAAPAHRRPPGSDGLPDQLDGAADLQVRRGPSR